ncbi:hypothetical protein [Nitrospira sp. Kam-Ns4a]
MGATLALLLSVSAARAQEDPLVLFAVITKVPKDRKQVTAQVAATTGPVTEATLIASDSILDNLIWKKLEVCHALRVEAWKNPEGYRVVGVKVLDAGMLPMTLQGLAGDCLLKKALEFAPMVD